jgi:hypothetical protein
MLRFVSSGAGLVLTRCGVAGADAGLLEDYPERGREHGHTKLLLGWTERGDPVHLVLNVASFESDSSEPVVLVTVYRPAPPWWTDERSRRVR